MTDDVIRQRGEISRQYQALGQMKKMAEIYGYDISEPATNAKRSSSVDVFWISGSC